MARARAVEDRRSPALPSAFREAAQGRRALGRLFEIVCQAVEIGLGENDAALVANFPLEARERRRAVLADHVVLIVDEGDAQAAARLEHGFGEEAQGFLDDGARVELQLVSELPELSPIRGRQRRLQTKRRIHYELPMFKTYS